ncbi:MAG: sodium/proton antiporter NhaB [Pseudomonadota bacterium]
MEYTLGQAFRQNFLGQSPVWYKLTIIGFLILNPVLLAALGENGPFIVGWLLVLEFIFTLAMALKCYPLAPGGLLAIEAVVIGLTTAKHVYVETEHNFQVIMLLMFMVAGIYFLKDMLLYTFTKILLNVRSKTLLSLMFSFVAAVLSAFLDALTVTAVIITVAAGFYGVYHRVASGVRYDDDHDAGQDDTVEDRARADLDQFRSFLRSLMMHGAVGTALGGVCTLVGEPQNLKIADVAGWEFVEFFLKVAPVSMPVLVVGLITCALLEKVKICGYGAEIPPNVREVLEDYDKAMAAKRTKRDTMALIAQAFVALVLVAALGLHLAEPGVIGLMVIILAAALNGVTQEHSFGHAFEEALPFTALLVVFFVIVAVIADQKLFSPVTTWLLAQEGSTQTALFYAANGFLSMISDNVFVATVYITEVKNALDAGIIDREQFDMLAVAINTGTNIPSVATPNGQAAFLFLLTSALAPLIRLSYGRMVIMALPYTVTMSIAGLLAVMYLLH